MPKVYVEAYDEHDRQILGNLDGQTVIQAKNYRRTKHYKALVQGDHTFTRPAHWRIRSESGICIEVIFNRKHEGKP